MLALANELVRIAWAVLPRRERFTVGEMALGKLFAFPIAAIKAEVIVTPMPGIETKRNGLAGMQRLPDSCYLAIGLSVATAASGSRIDVFNRHAFAQKLWERLNANNLGVANARPKRQSQLRNWSSQGCQLNDLDNSRGGLTLLRSPVWL